VLRWLWVFFGLMRAGEFCFKGAPYSVLCRQHVTWFSSHVRIFLPSSKTDRAKRGVSIKLFKNSSSVCPVTLLREAWSRAPVQQASAPLLQIDSRGSPLTYRLLLHFIKQQLSAFGFDASSFGAHSLRIGGATQLAANSFSEAQIQAMGRWSSDCYQRYLRFTDDFFQSVSSALGDSCSASPYGPCRTDPRTSLGASGMEAVVRPSEGGALL
jgi:hypothetical protein